MKVNIKHFAGKSPSFNVELFARDADAEPFITIKGCRIAAGRNGEFVSWPSSKKPDGSYWSHVYASEQFAGYVLKLAQKPADEEPF